MSNEKATDEKTMDEKTMDEKAMDKKSICTQICNIINGKDKPDNLHKLLDTCVTYENKDYIFWNYIALYNCLYDAHDSATLNSLLQWAAERQNYSNFVYSIIIKLVDSTISRFPEIPEISKSSKSFIYPRSSKSSKLLRLPKSILIEKIIDESKKINHDDLKRLYILLHWYHNTKNTCDIDTVEKNYMSFDMIQYLYLHHSDCTFMKFGTTKCLWYIVRLIVIPLISKCIVDENLDEKELDTCLSKICPCTINNIYYDFINEFKWVKPHGAKIFSFILTRVSQYSLNKGNCIIKTYTYKSDSSKWRNRQLSLLFVDICSAGNTYMINTINNLDCSIKDNIIKHNTNFKECYYLHMHGVKSSAITERISNSLKRNASIHYLDFNMLRHIIYPLNIEFTTLIGVIDAIVKYNRTNYRCHVMSDLILYTAKKDIDKTLVILQEGMSKSITTEVHYVLLEAYTELINNGYVTNRNKYYILPDKNEKYDCEVYKDYIDNKLIIYKGKAFEECKKVLIKDLSGLVMEYAIGK